MLCFGGAFSNFCLSLNNFFTTIHTACVAYSMWSFHCTTILTSHQIKGLKGVMRATVCRMRSGVSHSYYHNSYYSTVF